MTVPRFLRFAGVGAAGFFVDAGVLAFAVNVLALDSYSGRVLSYLCAATFTWAGNRIFTFADSAARTARGRAAEWAKFIGTNAAGGLVNYGIYAAMITFMPTPANNRYLGVAVGSLAGLAINYTLSRLVVFRPR